MTDTLKLLEAIKEKGLKRGYIASKLGIDRSTLWKKVTNQSEFTASEITALTDMLGLTKSDRDKIFFNV